MSESTSYLNLEAVQAHENVEARDYWKVRLKGISLLPPFDRCVSGTLNSTTAPSMETLQMPISLQVKEKIGQLAPSAKAVHVLMLSAMGLFACRYTAAGDPVIFTADPDYPGVSNDTSFLLPLCINGIHKLSTREYLVSMREQFVNAVNHGRYPLHRKLQTDQEQLLATPVAGILPYRHPACDLFSQLHTGLLLQYDVTHTGFIQFQYNTTLFSQEMMNRMAGSFIHLLDSMMADMNAAIAGFELIGESEKVALLDLLDNRNVAWPENETVVTLIEKQATLVPGNIAITYERIPLTYREINARANQLACHLRERGVCRNQVIGLLMDRSVEMLVAMLGILKAGGAYLPIDPDYPPERKQFLVEDSQTTCVVTTRTWSAGLENKVSLLCIDEMDLSVYSTENLTGVNEPGDLCYVIYTSGTTGNPKGVMIEHRQVVRLFFNEKFQFDFTTADVWTMFHSHCFDFSVWEIFGALFYGSRLIIIPKMIARDTSAFLNLLKEEKVTILNQTPSAFYNLVQTELDSHRSGLALRYVIFGGEALSPGKLKQWKERYPDVRLINMFGITETTVHVTFKEIGAKEIANNISNIGTPIPTLSVYIMDAHGKLLPVGCVGELFVGGAGVARGYLGKEELTQQKFTVHPYQPGERVYRSGDMARILSSGELEYLGRMDEQVKIRGFRIELGEIEYQLSQYPGIKKCVVIAGTESGQKYLAAYFVADAPLTTSALRNYLHQSLPDYMVPAYFIPLSSIPLTANGKLDRRSLPAPKAHTADEYVAPEGTKETLLCEVWQKVLGAEQIGVTDNFFSAGGDSIKSIQIISRMRTAGYELTVKDIFTLQTIRALAAVLRERHLAADQSEIAGSGRLSPVQSWFFSHRLFQVNHFNQSVLLSFPEGITLAETTTIFSKLQSHHDTLRMVFRKKHDDWTRETLPVNNLPLRITEIDLRDTPEATNQLTLHCNQIQASGDISTGPLMRLGLFHLEQGSRLLIVIHHLAVDGLSWRILLEDIETLLTQVRSGNPISLPAKTDSFHQWSVQLERYMATRDFKMASRYWDLWASSMQLTPLPLDKNIGFATNRTKRTITAVLNPTLTEQFLKHIHDRFGTGPDDILLTALNMSLEKSFGIQEVCIDLEGHGREDILSGINISRTVGWFTSICPVSLPGVNANTPMNNRIKLIKEQIRRIPNKGIDYLLWKYSGSDDGPVLPNAEICFNYLGQFDTDTSAASFHFSGEDMGDVQSPDNEMLYKWEVTALVSGGELRLVLGYSAEQYEDTTAARLMQSFKENLVELIRYCLTYAKKELTPADLTYKELPAAVLEKLSEQYELEDIYPLSPLQEGLYFHAQVDEDSDAYFEQITFTWEGTLDMQAVERALMQLSERYTVLRTAFIHTSDQRPLQVVAKHSKLACKFGDIREEANKYDRNELLQRYRELDRRNKFDIERPGLMRLWILRTGENFFEFLWSHHHIIMDGWCMSLVIRDFGLLYNAACNKLTAALPPVKQYGNYINWLEKSDKAQSAAYWRNYLQGYDKAVVFPELEKTTGQHEGKGQCSLTFSPGKESTAKIHSLCAQYAVTPNIVMQSVWGLLVSKYNNTGDVVFGVVVSGRPGELEGVEQMVGLFINTVPVRVRYHDRDTAVSLMHSLREDAVQSEPYHYHSLAAIMQESEAGRNLVSHILVFENYPVEQEIQAANQPGEGSYSVTNASVSEYTNYPLAILITPGKEFRIEIQYNGDVYAQETIARMRDHFLHILQQVTDHPERLADEVQLVTEKEEECIRNVFNDTEAVFPEHMTIVDLFETQAEKTPGNTAFIYKNKHTDYRTLSAQSTAVAEYLRDRYDVKAGDLVGVFMTRNEYLIPVLFGILKAGAAYVPVDPSFPPARTVSLFADASIRTIITTNADAERLPQGAYRVITLGSQWDDILTMLPDGPARTHAALPGNLAYVIFTSGSTGVPKGVMIGHRALVNRLCWMQKKYPLTEHDVLIQKTPLVFDVSLWELFWWSQTGASLCIPEDGTEKSPEQINHAIENHQVSVIHFVPSMLSAYMTECTGRFDYRTIKSLKRVFVSGEAIRPEQVNLFGATLYRHNGTELINLYGPTEATVDVSFYSCSFSDSDQRTIPIGKPIDNTTLLICDRNMQLMPIGVPGELCIGGVGLAKGYLNNPQLTEQKFRYQGKGQLQRFYHSGDLARWLPDGNIEYLGRQDHQVKIRGFRIETGEIEFHLAAIEGVRTCLVTVKEMAGEKLLCAYYTAETPFSTKELKSILLQVLPAYMIPAYFIHLKEFPLTSNGKLDRKALPDPTSGEAIQTLTEYSGLEQQLMEIWATVLKSDTQQLSIHANFFDVGGDSIRILNLRRQINATLNLQVTAADVFRHPTISSFVSFLNGQTSNQEAYKEKLSREADEMNDALHLFSND